MAKLGQGTSYADKQIYRSDNEPDDNRDGILWVDTSNSPATTKLYDAAADSWEGITEKNLPSWGLIHTHEDTDDSTVFDMDTGVMSETYDEYQVRVQLWSYGTGNGKLAMQLNGDTSTSYSYHRLDSGSISQATGGDEFFVAQFDASDIKNIGGFIGMSCSEDPSGEQGYPKVNGNLEARSGGGVLLNGRLNATYSAINQINLYSTPPGTGKAEVYARNFG